MAGGGPGEGPTLKAKQRRFKQGFYQDLSSPPRPADVGCGRWPHGWRVPPALCRYPIRLAAAWRHATVPRAPPAPTYAERRGRGLSVPARPVTGGGMQQRHFFDKKRQLALRIAQEGQLDVDVLLARRPVVRVPHALALTGRTCLSQRARLTVFSDFSTTGAGLWCFDATGFLRVALARMGQRKMVHFDLGARRFYIFSLVGGSSARRAWW